MSEAHSNPGLDALWAYARSQPQKEEYVDRKQTSFDAWWATLTPAEQKVIGRTNAKFVWLEACEACAKVADEWSGHYQANEIANKIRESIKS